MRATGGPETALYVFLAFYLSCAIVNWVFYARKRSMLHCPPITTEPAA